MFFVLFCSSFLFHCMMAPPTPLDMGTPMLAHVALLVLSLQLLVQLIGHPYTAHQQLLQTLDVASICVCWFTMWSGFFFLGVKQDWDRNLLLLLTMVVLFVNIIHMVVLLGSMIMEICKENKESKLISSILVRTSSMVPARIKKYREQKRLSALVEAANEKKNGFNYENPVLEKMSLALANGEDVGVEMTALTATTNAVLGTGETKNGKSGGGGGGGGKNMNAKAQAALMKKEKRKKKMKKVRRRLSLNQKVLHQRENALEKEREGEGETKNVVENTRVEITIENDEDDDDQMKSEGELEILTDERTGKRYSYHHRTGETAWLDVPVEEEVKEAEGEETEKVMGEEEEQEEEQESWAEYSDGEGRAYLVSSLTGESKWKDEL